MADSLAESGEPDGKIDPLEFSRLELDETNISVINETDKKYLETFEHLTALAMNQTNLKSLDNLP